MFSRAHLALSGVCINLRVPGLTLGGLSGLYGIQYPRPLLTLANDITFKIQYLHALIGRAVSANEKLRSDRFFPTFLCPVLVSLKGFK